MIELRGDWKWYAAVTAAVLVVCASLAWFFSDGIASPDAVIATPSKVVSDTPKIGIPVKKPLKVYAGGTKLKDKIGLPADVAQNDAQHVVSSTTVNCDQPHTITTVIDAETGESQTYDQLAPRPWLASNDQGKVGIYAVFKNGTPTVILQGRRGLFSVKSLDFVGVAGIDHTMSGTGDLGTQIGIGLEF